MGKKAVVLSGGGAKGGYQIGVWKVLSSAIESGRYSGCFSTSIRPLP